MNIAIISGTLVSDAVVRGLNKDKSVLLFTVATKNGSPEGDANQSINYVPCCMFSPSPEMQKILSKGKGLRISLQGRINSSKVESNGQTSFKTEVVVYNKSVEVIDLGE